MNQLLICLLVVLLHGVTATAQTKNTSDSSNIIKINQDIDNNVVQNNITVLDKLYADDFIFSHGSGKVEGKQSWFTSVAKGSFVSRKHDSVTVELHPPVGIVRGKLNVQKKANDRLSRYYLKYVRVFAYRDEHWQLISHVTTFEFHEPEQ